MIERFRGDGHRALVAAIQAQRFVQGKADIAEDLINAGELIEYPPESILITQDDGSNDIFLLVAGTVKVVANGVEIRTLSGGVHVGEMSAIHPANPRSATVSTVTTVVAVKVPASQFIAICDKDTETWKSIAQELSNRLFDRNRLIKPPNDKPKVFIMSSVEALKVARAIQAGLQHDCLPTVWTDGAFWVSGYPLESLEKAVEESDFGVAVAQFEDVVHSRGDSHAAMRDNVLFELGMFVGRLGRHRTVLAHPRLADLKLPSDLHGITPSAFILPTKPEELAARIAPVCTEIRGLIEKHGTRHHPA